jgi:hypothetical protein
LAQGALAQQQAQLAPMPEAHLAAPLFLTHSPQQVAVAVADMAELLQMLRGLTAVAAVVAASLTPH